MKQSRRRFLALFVGLMGVPTAFAFSILPSSSSSSSASSSTSTTPSILQKHSEQPDHMAPHRRLYIHLPVQTPDTVEEATLAVSSPSPTETSQEKPQISIMAQFLAVQLARTLVLKQQTFASAIHMDGEAGGQVPDMPTNLSAADTETTIRSAQSAAMSMIERDDACPSECEGIVVATRELEDIPVRAAAQSPVVESIEKVTRPINKNLNEKITSNVQTPESLMEIQPETSEQEDTSLLVPSTSKTSESTVAVPSAIHRHEALTLANDSDHTLPAQKTINKYLPLVNSLGKPANTLKSMDSSTAIDSTVEKLTTNLGPTPEQSPKPVTRLESNSLNPVSNEATFSKTSDTNDRSQVQPQPLAVGEASMKRKVKGGPITSDIFASKRPSKLYKYLPRMAEPSPAPAVQIPAPTEAIVTNAVVNTDMNATSTPAIAAEHKYLPLHTLKTIQSKKSPSRRKKPRRTPKASQPIASNATSSGSDEVKPLKEERKSSKQQFLPLVTLSSNQQRSRSSNQKAVESMRGAAKGFCSNSQVAAAGLEDDQTSTRRKDSKKQWLPLSQKKHRKADKKQSKEKRRRAEITGPAQSSGLEMGVTTTLPTQVDAEPAVTGSIMSHQSIVSHFEEISNQTGTVDFFDRATGTSVVDSENCSLPDELFAGNQVLKQDDQSDENFSAVALTQANEAKDCSDHVIDHEDTLEEQRIVSIIEMETQAEQLPANTAIDTAVAQVSCKESVHGPKEVAVAQASCKESDHRLEENEMVDMKNPLHVAPTTMLGGHGDGNMKLSAAATAQINETALMEKDQPALTTEIVSLILPDKEASVKELNSDLSYVNASTTDPTPTGTVTNPISNDPKPAFLKPIKNEATISEEVLEKEELDHYLSTNDGHFMVNQVSGAISFFPANNVTGMSISSSQDKEQLVTAISTTEHQTPHKTSSDTFVIRSLQTVKYISNDGILVKNTDLESSQNLESAISANGEAECLSANQTASDKLRTEPSSAHLTFITPTIPKWKNSPFGKKPKATKPGVGIGYLDDIVGVSAPSPSYPKLPPAPAPLALPASSQPDVPAVEQQPEKADSVMNAAELTPSESTDSSLGLKSDIESEVAYVIYPEIDLKSIAASLAESHTRKTLPAAVKSEEHENKAVDSATTKESDMEDLDIEYDVDSLDWRAFRAKLVLAEPREDLLCDALVDDCEDYDGIGELFFDRVSTQNKIRKMTPLNPAQWAYDSGRNIEQGTVILGGVEQDFGFGLRQQYFHKAAMLVLDHNDDSFTKGIILNRPSDFELEDDLNPGVRWRVWFGGDVQGIHSDKPDLVCLHSIESPEAQKASITVMNGLQWTTFKNAKRLVKAGVASPNDFQVFCGYAGWGPGVLRNEVDRKFWYTVATDSQTLIKELAQIASSDPREAGLETWYMLMSMIGREALARSYDGGFDDMMLKEWSLQKLLSDVGGGCAGPKKRILDGTAGQLAVLVKHSGSDYVTELAARSVDENLVGCLVRASARGRSPFLLQDQELHKSVLLIVLDDDKLTVGAILNRPAAEGLDLPVVPKDRGLCSSQKVTVPLRFGGQYTLKNEEPLLWIHCSEKLRRANIGFPMNNIKGGIWKCKGEEVTRALSRGLATTDDFLVVTGVSAWTKEGSRGGIQDEISSGKFEMVPISKTQTVWQSLIKQKVLRSDTLFENMKIADEAWANAGWSEHESFVRLEESQNRPAQEDPRIFKSAVKVSDLADEALTNWVATFLLGVPVEAFS